MAMITFPESAFSSLFMILRSVDFPAPFIPTIAAFSRASSWKLIFFNISSCPYDFVIFCTASIIMVSCFSKVFVKVSVFGEYPVGKNSDKQTNGILADVNSSFKGLFRLKSVYLYKNSAFLPFFTISLQQFC